MNTAIHSRPGPVSKTARRRAERLIADHLPALASRALELALLGDPLALQMCLDRAWPVDPAQGSKREARALE